MGQVTHGRWGPVHGSDACYLSALAVWSPDHFDPKAPSYPKCQEPRDESVPHRDGPKETGDGGHFAVWKKGAKENIPRLRGGCSRESLER